MGAAELSLAWWSWIVPSALQATILLALAWVVDRLLVRRAWPQLLSTIWLVALARLMLPPSISSPWSVTRPLGAPVFNAADAVRQVLGTTDDVLALEAIAAAWLAGCAGLVLARVVRRVRLSRRIEPVHSPAWSAAVRRAARTIGLGRAPRMGTLPALGSPAVTGLLRPVLLVPRSALERAPDARDFHALLHELSHLARRDLWLDEVCEVVRALFWFHPLVWIAVHRVRALGELACDESVARHLGREAPSYRDTLVLAARVHIGTPSLRGVRAFLGAPSAILLRIERLDRAALRPLAAVRSASLALAVLLAACVLPMAPATDDLRAHAQAVFDAELHGKAQSCFVLHAAAIVLAASESRSADRHGD